MEHRPARRSRASGRPAASSARSSSTRSCSAYERSPTCRTSCSTTTSQRRWSSGAAGLAPGRRRSRSRLRHPRARRSRRSLAYFDSYRTARLPQNLTQAQRDFFGAHTYQRTDKPGAPAVHTEWLKGFESRRPRSRRRAHADPLRGRRQRPLRWGIVSLLFLATLINYIDRQTVSVLAPVLQAELALSNLDYATIGTVLPGRLYRCRCGCGGPSSIGWATAPASRRRSRCGRCGGRARPGGHAERLSRRSVSRSGPVNRETGRGPPAPWRPGSCRGSARWPWGSSTAGPRWVRPWRRRWSGALQARYGWQAAFLVTGALGFLWLAAWLVVYPAARASGGRMRPRAVPWRQLLRRRRGLGDRAGAASSAIRSGGCT